MKMCYSLGGCMIIRKSTGVYTDNPEIGCIIDIQEI